MITRRRFLQASIAAALASGAPWYNLIRRSYAAPQMVGLSNPVLQPLFTEPAPNAMAAGFKYAPKGDKLRIIMAQTVQQTGLVDTNGTRLPTTVWGYGENGKTGVSWPGRTIERHVNDDPLEIKWENKLLDPATGLPLPHLLPVDTNLHWVYSIGPMSSANGVDYTQYSIENDGVPMVPHVHGGRNDSPFDGNPEYFFAPGWNVRGPRWTDKKYVLGGPDWNNKAGMMWYHDHALGITRLNVYAGLAGFFPLRDNEDTGKPDNPIGLPADPYELGYAVQDRMFRDTGELFYPAFPGDPTYDEFINGEGAVLPPDLFPGGGPTALAEFFGDHMLVNGKIWPKASVEARQYRVRWLNGSDSRFMRLRLKVIPAGAGNPAATNPADGYTLPFLVLGSDQSLRATAAQVETVDFLPGERLDVLFDFSAIPFGSRVIVENLLGDSPFGGQEPGPEDVFENRLTDRIMAFDVEVPFDASRPDTTIKDGDPLGGGLTVPDTGIVRKLGLFEGADEFGRLQPLLGTAEPVTDVNGNTGINGTLTWAQPITENPGLGNTEVWEVYNATGDAHPIHVHLVHFEVMNREGFAANVVPQPTAQHNGAQGAGYRLEGITTDGNLSGPAPSEQTRRDMVLSLPGEVTRIRMTFDKPGRYVWHCHILSHEDHEMMRPFHVGPV
ncbi:MAG TPA: multicopper oxidase domain-containing protein [Gammaproteobacteria bacterium]|nr:multicopper oxidase domain-containing protein [Gammaproteobacteria bacterium]